jgi:hypothetical protein
MGCLNCSQNLPYQLFGVDYGCMMEANILDPFKYLVTPSVFSANSW